MSDLSEPEGDLEPAERELGTQLQDERPIPPTEFRGALKRHLAAYDTGHAHRPEHLRRSASLYVAAGGLLAGMGVLQALGVL